MNVFVLELIMEDYLYLLNQITTPSYQANHVLGTPFVVREFYNDTALNSE